MGLLKIIEWKDDSTDTIVHKYFINKKDFITKGSVLVVRDSQAAIFADKGKMADVFLPGQYKLDTDNVPLLTKLMSWKYGFESPFKSDIYYVNTKQFTNRKWGTMNPIMIRDKDFGPVRIRGFGTYAFRVSDPYVFMQELSGTNSSFETGDIDAWLRSIIVTGITDTIAESKIPVLDMAANLLELGEIVQKALSPDLEKIGIELTKFNFENFSLPENLEKVLDKTTELGMMRGSMDVYTQMAQADALRDAAKNPGMAGSMIGAGIGVGMGAGMGRTFNSAFSNPPAVEKTEKCPACGATAKEGSKFCPECGKPMQALCPKCGKPVKEGAKFCAECGASLQPVCPKCGAKVNAGAKFCPECGERL